MKTFSVESDPMWVHSLTISTFGAILGTMWGKRTLGRQVA